MFASGVMAGLACMALTIPRFIALEVLEGLRSPPRHWAAIPVVRIVAVIHVAIEAARPMEPWTCPEE